MALQHLAPDARTRPRPLLIGAGGDLELVDISGMDATGAARLVAGWRRTGAGVIVSGGSEESAPAAEAAGALVMVVGAGDGPLDRAAALVGHGVPVGSLVVEVPFGPGPVPGRAVAAVGAAGFAAGMSLHGAEVPHADPEAAAGWEIGALTATLALPVRTVRGVSAQRFRRVAAVVEAIAAGRAGAPQQGELG